MQACSMWTYFCKKDLAKWSGPILKHKFWGITLSLLSKYGFDSGDYHNDSAPSSSNVVKSTAPLIFIEETSTLDEDKCWWIMILTITIEASTQELSIGCKTLLLTLLSARKSHIPSMVRLGRQLLTMCVSWTCFFFGDVAIHWIKINVDE